MWLCLLGTEVTIVTEHNPEQNPIDTLPGRLLELVIQCSTYHWVPRPSYSLLIFVVVLIVEFFESIQAGMHMMLYNV